MAEQTPADACRCPAVTCGTHGAADGRAYRCRLVVGHAGAHEARHDPSGILGWGHDDTVDTVHDDLTAEIERLRAEVRPKVDADTRAEIERIIGHLRDDLPGWLDLLDRWTEMIGKPTDGDEVQRDLRRAAELLSQLLGEDT